MKFLRIIARHNGFWRAGVEHSTTPTYYPMKPIPPDERGAFARKIQEMGGEMRAFFKGREGKERGQFTPEEILELKREPKLVVDEIEVTIEVPKEALGAESGEKPKKPAA